MAFGNEVPDKTLLKTVMQRLNRKGGAVSKVSVSVISGEVTLSGTIPTENDRKPIIKSCNSTPGVNRVIDQLEITPRRQQ